MTIHSISDYHKAKQYVKDLERVLKIVNATEASLRNYENYRLVHTILTTIAYEKPFIEMALEQSKIVVDSKGEMRKR